MPAAVAAPSGAGMFPQTPAELAREDRRKRLEEAQIAGAEQEAGIERPATQTTPGVPAPTHISTKARNDFDSGFGEFVKDTTGLGDQTYFSSSDISHVQGMAGQVRAIMQTIPDKKSAARLLKTTGWYTALKAALEAADRGWRITSTGIGLPGMGRSGEDPKMGRYRYALLSLVDMIDAYERGE